MKNLLLTGTAVLLAGCASTVPFTLKSAPPGYTKEQIQLDNLTCSNMSRTNGPWAYGIGTAIIRAEAAKRYQKCMSDKGYVVQRGSGEATPVPQSTAGSGVGKAASDAFDRLNPSSKQQAPDTEAPTAPAATQPVKSEAPASAPVSVPSATALSAPASSVAPGSPASRLKELEKLYKAGLITKKEYEQKRQEILATL